MIHHLVNAFWHHSKVFAAGKHTGGGEQFRNLLLAVVLPEGFVTVVEKVPVHSVKGLFLPEIQCRCVRRDAGVEPAFAVRIFKEDGRVFRKAGLGQFIRAVRQRRIEMALAAA